MEKLNKKFKEGTTLDLIMKKLEEIEERLEILENPEVKA